MTREQKKYLWMRTVVWAFVCGTLAVAAEWLGKAAGLFHSGWMESVIIALAGGYFPGFTGGIWKLYRDQIKI